MNYTIGNKDDSNWWIRYTDDSGIYWWYHPDGGWVTEPNQINHPCFATESEAFHAATQITDAPPPARHQWREPTELIKHPFCAKCLIIRRTDGKSDKNWCKGPSRLRTMENSPHA